MIIDKNIPDKELLEACYQGDSDAINIFFERYKDLIYSAIHKWINRYAKDTEREENVKKVFQDAVLDIMEDGFAKLKEARDPSRITGLIFIITYHRAGKYFKKRWLDRKRRAEEEPEGPDGTEPLDALSREERIKVVGEFIEGLSPIERKIMELRFSEELKYGEIAVETGLSSANVGVMINRIKEKLRIFIKEKYPSFANFT